MAELPPIVQHVIIKVDKAIDSQRRLKKESAELDKQLDSTNRSADGSERHFSGLDRAVTKLATSVRPATAEMGKFHQSNKDTSSSLGTVTTRARDASRDITSLTSHFSGFRKATADTRKEWDAMGPSMARGRGELAAVDSLFANVEKSATRSARAVERHAAAHDSSRRSVVGHGAALAGLTRAFGQTSVITNLFSRTLSLIKFPAIILGVNLLAGALSALAGGAYAAVAALGPLTGLLGALPGLGIAAATGIGAIFASFSGVGSALKAYSAQQKEARTATSKTGGAVSKAAHQQRDAAARVADAQKAVGQASADAAEQIQQAEQSLADARENGADSIRAAERSLADAEDRSTQAQKDLNAAREDAIARLRDLREEQEKNRISVERADIALEEARKRLIEVSQDPGADPLDRRKAILDVRDAELSLVDARQKKADQDKELSTATKKGVEGDDQVVAARKALIDANQALADSQVALVRAHRDSIRAITQAEKALVKAHTSGSQSITDAQKGVRDALESSATGSDAASTAASNLQEALANLTPAGRAFALTLFSMKDAWDTFRKSVADATLPGFTDALNKIKGIIPQITPLVAAMGSVIGDAVDKFAGFLASPDILTRLKNIMFDNVGVAANFGKAFLGISDAFIVVATAARPLVRWIGDLVGRFGDYISKVTRVNEANGDLHDFFKKVRQVATKVGHTLRDLFSAFYNIGRIGSQVLGQKLLGNLEKVAHKFRDWTESAKGQNSIRKYFENIAVPLQAAGRLIGDIFTGFGKLATSTNLGPLIDQVDKTLLPALLNVFDTVSSGGLGKQLVTLATSVTTFFGAIAGESGPLLKAVGFLSKIIDFLTIVVTKTPGARSAVFTVSTAAGLLAAISFTKFLTGWKKVADALNLGPGLLKGVSNGIKDVPLDLEKHNGLFTRAGHKIGDALRTGIMEPLKDFGHKIIDLINPSGAGRRAANRAKAAAKKTAGKAAEKTAEKAVEDKAAEGAAGAAGGAAAGVGLEAAAAPAEGAAAAAGLGFGAIAAIIAAAIAAIGAALLLAYHNIKPFRELIDSTWQAIQKGWDKVLPVLKSIGRFFEKVFKPIGDHIKGVGLALLGLVTLPISGPLAVITAGFQLLRNHMEGLKKALGAVGRVLGDVFGPALKAVGSAVAFIAPLIGKFLVGAFNALATAAAWAWDHVVHPIFTAIVAVTRDVVIPAFKLMSAIWQDVWDIIQGIIGFAWNDVIKPIWEHLVGFMDGPMNDSTSRTRDIFKSVFGAIGKVIGKTWDLVKPIFHAIVDFINKSIIPRVGRLHDVFVNVFSGIRDFMGKVWDDIIGIIHTAIEGVKKVLKPVLGGIADVLDFVGLNHIANAIRGFVDAPSESAHSQVQRRADEGGKFQGRASGGMVPAASHRTTKRQEVGAGFMAGTPRAIVGEGSRYPEFVIPTDPAYRRNALHLTAALIKRLDNGKGQGARGKEGPQLPSPFFARGGEIPAHATGTAQLLLNTQFADRAAHTLRKFGLGIASTSPDGTFVERARTSGDTYRSLFDRIRFTIGDRSFPRNNFASDLAETIRAADPFASVSHAGTARSSEANYSLLTNAVRTLARLYLGISDSFPNGGFRARQATADDTPDKLFASALGNVGSGKWRYRNFRSGLERAVRQRDPAAHLNADNTLGALSPRFANIKGVGEPTSPLDALLLRLGAKKSDIPNYREFLAGNIQSRLASNALPGTDLAFAGGGILDWSKKLLHPSNALDVAAGILDRGKDVLGGVVNIGARAAAATIEKVWPEGVARKFDPTPDPGFFAGLLDKGRSGLLDILRGVGGVEDSERAKLGAGLGGPGSVLPATLAARGPLIEMARGLAAGRGWTGGEFNALVDLWNKESGWNPNAKNPSSSAYGIAQFLDKTWAGVGATKTSDPRGQIIAGLDYIARVYHSPGQALGKWLSRSPHWYGGGGEMAGGGGHFPARDQIRGAMSEGGVTLKEGLYRMSEANRREATLPLDNPRAMALLRDRLGTGGVGPVSFEFNFNAPIYGVEDLDKHVESQVDTWAGKLATALQAR